VYLCAAIELGTDRGATLLSRRIISAQEASKLLRIHSITLYRMLKAGEIPGAFKVGRVWRIDLEDLERFLEAKPRGE
jgi:excisionase family DNA binding protein